MRNDSLVACDLLSCFNSALHNLVLGLDVALEEGLGLDCLEELKASVLHSLLVAIHEGLSLELVESLLLVHRGNLSCDINATLLALLTFALAHT